MPQRLCWQLYTRRQSGTSLGRAYGETEEVTFKLEEGKTCMDEVEDVIVMPHSTTTASQDGAYKTLKLDEDVVANLREYVATIASLYRNNKFHCFEHAW
jgi:hypothetical protein